MQADLLQERPCPVAGASRLRDELAARAQNIRTQARVALYIVMAEHDASPSGQLRPTAEREFLVGDYIAYKENTEA